MYGFREFCEILTNINKEDLEKYRKLYTIIESKETISIVKFSPCSRYFSYGNILG